MARIKPFRGYRPPIPLAQQVASPPYDVLNTEEARAMAAGNAVSFLHVSKSEIDLPAETDPYASEVYARARTNMRKFIADGVLVQDGSPCFYLYRQRMGDHVQVGLVAGASVVEYDQGLIKKHEFTRKDKEDDRVRHIDALDANDEPVFLTYRAVNEVDALVDVICNKAPTYDFRTDDGIGHTFWVVDGPGAIQSFIDAFAKIPALYVADGHHRSAAASRVRKLRGDDPEAGYSYFLAVIFPHDQMKIMEYNRLVKDLDGMDADAFMARVMERFDVCHVEEGRPSQEKVFGMYLNGHWHQLVAKPGSYPVGDPVKSLDVAVLQDNLLGPVLGIQDPRTDKRIDFVGGIRGISELERRCKAGWAVAFALYPTQISQLMAVADSGQVMPPKSTWFEPKLRSGLVVRSLADR